MTEKQDHAIFAVAAQNFPLKCQDCGETDGVKPGICPYDDDVKGVITPVILCEECSDSRAQEI